MQFEVQLGQETFFQRFHLLVEQVHQLDFFVLFQLELTALAFAHLDTSAEQTVMVEVQAINGTTPWEGGLLSGVALVELDGIVSRLHKDTPRVGKQIYITGWVYDAEGQRRYPRAIYAIGSKPDAKKPKASALDNRRRYDRKRHAMFSMNSVFNMGKSRDTLRAERRATA